MSMSFSLVSRLILSRFSSRGWMYSIRVLFFYVRLLVVYSTPQKIINAAGCKIQKWMRRDMVWGMPYRYTIDPLNICNLHCPLCPTGLGILGREKGKMSLDNFKALIDQIASYAYIVEMYNWGEPFLHGDIFDMIHYAHSRKMAVRLSTNLNRFNQEMAIETIKSGLDAINISVDGVTQETYERYRRGGKLSKVIDNIKTLVEEKENAKSHTPFITLRMLVNRYNEHEISRMRELAKILKVDAFSIGTTFVDTTNGDQVKEWLPLSEAYSSYDYSSDQPENVWHCADLWESVTINWDGGLAPCCWLHQKGHDFENAFDHPIKIIWNGDAYQSSRRVFAFRGPKEGTISTICTRCKGKPLYLKD